MIEATTREATLQVVTVAAMPVAASPDAPGWSIGVSGALVAVLEGLQRLPRRDEAARGHGDGR